MWRINIRCVESENWNTGFEREQHFVYLILPVFFLFFKSLYLFYTLLSTLFFSICFLLKIVSAACPLPSGKTYLSPVFLFLCVLFTLHPFFNTLACIFSTANPSFLLISELSSILASFAYLCVFDQYLASFLFGNVCIWFNISKASFLLRHEHEESFQWWIIYSLLFLLLLHISNIEITNWK